MKILVTGAAGFIGAAVSRRLLERGDEVVGVDNLNSYYAVSLKEARLARLTAFPKFRFFRCEISDAHEVAEIFRREEPQRVVNLAAQAGVRHSLDAPHAYIDSNVTGFLSVLEACRRSEIEHLVYASSSSVYGIDGSLPFSESKGASHPLSLYGATKRTNELMAHAYSHLFAVPVTGLRFFTVYGPWGRPDMAPFRFTRQILEGKPIPVYNHGNHRRDFTYIDDIVEGVTRVLDRPASAADHWDPEQPDAATSRAPYRIYNIGNGNPIRLEEFIEVLEGVLERKAARIPLPFQAGDVAETAADTGNLERDFGFRPTTGLRDGLAKFVDWYRSFYGDSLPRGGT